MCVMKFCQIDKISTHTCIFAVGKFCKLDKISIVTAKRSDYLKYHWGQTLINWMDDLQFYVLFNSVSVISG